MAEVLLTGATGLLGSRVVTALAEGHRVTAIARRPPEHGGEIGWVAHDLRAPKLPVGLPARIDVVIHLAQSRQFRNFPEKALDVHAVNVGSTVQLLDWAHRGGARLFILASTGGVYPPGPFPHREDELVDLGKVASFYAASKLAAESLARSYERHFSVIVLRPFFIYGRGQEGSMFLPRIAQSVRSGNPISLDGPDGLVCNPIHVSDATRAVVGAIALAESSVLNIAGPETLTLRQIATVLAEPLGTDPVFQIRAAQRPPTLVGDISAMTTLLGAPETRLGDVAEELHAGVPVT